MRILDHHVGSGPHTRPAECRIGAGQDIERAERRQTVLKLPVDPVVRADLVVDPERHAAVVPEVARIRPDVLVVV